MVEVGMWVVIAYLALCFAKFCLMVTTAHVAASVHQRVFARQGQVISWGQCYCLLVVASVFVVLFNTPRSLYNEGWSFFRSYTRREVMRDVVRSLRA